MNDINWTDAQSIITVGGFALIVLTVYAETGLFFCFFLPGDYLLFAAGLFAAPMQQERGALLDVPILVLCGALFLAAVAGNYTGYLFGKFLGKNLEHRKDSFFFKRKYIENTRKVFDKYGGRALIIGRFLPVVRTFAPILAGIIKMEMGMFALYNTIGAALWVLVLCLSGYFLGEAFGEQMFNILPYIIAGFLAFTTGSLLLNWWKLRREVK
jgi:membrane-associated protein